MASEVAPEPELPIPLQFPTYSKGFWHLAFAVMSLGFCKDVAAMNSTRCVARGDIELTFKTMITEMYAKWVYSGNAKAKSDTQVYL